MRGNVRKLWVHVLSRDPHENNCRVCVVASKCIIVVFPSYLDLLMLKYGDRMEKSWVTHCRVEEEGLSFREAERVIESELFLDEYPWRGLGTPHQMVILHEMFLHTAGWGWKEAECMCHWGCWGSILEPNPEADQSTMELVGYQTSRKGIRDVYHSVYLLRRPLGSPCCGESRRRRAILDILSSLQTHLQRQTYSAKAQDLGAHGGEWVGSDPLQSYEAALWAAHQKALETAKALWSDLKRLNDECRGRSWVCSQNRSRPRTQSRNQARTHLRNCSRGWVRACSQSHPHTDPQSVWSQSLDKPPDRRVSFCEPENEDSMTEESNPLAEPSINDLGTWLEYQVRQLGTPTWWGELEAIPDIANLCSFARKIRVSFYVLEVQSRMFPKEGFFCTSSPLKSE